MDHSTNLVHSHSRETLAYFRLLLANENNQMAPTPANGWKLQPSKNHNLNLYKRNPTPNKQQDRANTKLYLAEATIRNHSVKTIVNAIQTSQTEWDKDCIEHRAILMVSENTRITYKAFKTSSSFLNTTPLTESDSILVQHNVVSDSSASIINFSIESTLIEKNPFRFREKPTLLAFHLEKIDSSPHTRILFCIQENLSSTSGLNENDLKKFFLRKVSTVLGGLVDWLDRNKTIPLSNIDKQISMNLNDITPHATENQSSRPQSAISQSSTISSSVTDIVDDQSSITPSTMSRSVQPKFDTIVKILNVDPEVKNIAESLILPPPPSLPPLAIAPPPLHYTKIEYPLPKHHDLALGALSEMKRLTSLDNNSWAVNGEQRGVKIYMLDDGSPVVGMPTVRGEAIWDVEGNGDSVENFLAVIMSRGARKTWDPRFESSTSVEYLNPLQGVFHSFQKGQFPVSGRDFFYMQSLFYEDNVTYLIQNSIPSTPEHAPGKVSSSFVRADLVIGGWRIEKLSQSQLKISYIVHADPRGTIPSRLLKLVSVQTPLNVAGVIDFIQNYGFPIRANFIGNYRGLEDASAYTKLISEETVGTLYTCSFFLYKNDKSLSHYSDGMVQFNMSEKLFPRGCDVEFDAIDVMDVVVDADELYVRCYVKEDLDCLSEPRKVSVKVSKRVVSGRKSADRSFHLNGGLMPLDTRGKSVKTPTILKSAQTIDDDAVSIVVERDIIVEQEKVVEVIKNNIHIQKGLSANLLQRSPPLTDGSAIRSPTPRSFDSVGSSLSSSRLTSFNSLSIQKHETKPRTWSVRTASDAGTISSTISSKKSHSISRPTFDQVDSHHSSISIIESMIYLFWASFLVIVPFIPHHIPTLFSSYTIELVLSIFLVTKTTSFISKINFSHTAIPNLLIAFTWFATGSLLLVPSVAQVMETEAALFIALYVAFYFYAHSRVKEGGGKARVSGAGFDEFGKNGVASLGMFCLVLVFTGGVFLAGMEGVGNGVFGGFGHGSLVNSTKKI